MIKKFSLVITGIIILAAGCSQMKYAGEERSEGERLFRAKCRSCHVLPDPKDKNDNEWAKFIPAHVGGKNIAEESRSAIVDFLISHNE